MIRTIQTTLEDFPIYLAFEHPRRGPCYVEVTRKLTRCAELRHALELVYSPTVAEGAKLFRQMFERNLRAALSA